MNKLDISEIRRRLNPEKNNIALIHGCYVSDKGEIISRFSRAPLNLPQEEYEKYLAILRRTLTGMPGKNMLDIGFSADAVMHGEEHKLLTSLKNTALKVEQAMDRFFQRVIETTDIEGNYLILLVHDAYDVPFRAKDEHQVEDSSEDVFNYILCSICPVKLTRPALRYCADDQNFHERDLDWVVSAPEIGFMFPAFVAGGADIYNAWFFTRDAANAHDKFVNGIFGGNAPMPAETQKEIFDAILEDSLLGECSLDVVQTVHDNLRERVEEVKADKHADAPVISKREVKSMLMDCGVSEERVAAFEEKYDAEFGATDLPVQNVVNVKQFELRTPDVVIHINPERSDLVDTRTIDGISYILIRADEGVEVNGVNINIADLGENV